MSRMRLTGAADRARGERDELLRDLSDEWPPAGGSRAVASAQGRLAAHARRDGGAALAGKKREPVDTLSPRLPWAALALALVAISFVRLRLLDAPLERDE